MISKSCEYAIKATLFIAQKSLIGHRVSLKEIAAAIESPVAFTSKILQTLARAQIIDSSKGPNGGFDIQKERLAKTNLKQIVLAIDGDRLFDACALGLSVCSEEEPCPLHKDFIVIRKRIEKSLQSSNLFNLSKDLNLGQFVLKNSI